MASIISDASAPRFLSSDISFPKEKVVSSLRERKVLKKFDAVFVDVRILRATFCAPPIPVFE